MSRPVDLPDFLRPPVAEVVLGIQFDDLVSLRHVDLARVFDVFRDSYPHLQEVQPLSPEFEMFGVPGLQLNPPLRVTFGPPIPRLWFESSNRSELLQFQSNRFVYNWRKSEGQTYPRYENVRDAFQRAALKLQAFLKDAGHAPLVLNQCEVTYINIIPVLEGEAEPTARVFRFWGTMGSRTLDEPEDVSLNIRFVFRDARGNPKSRLTANAFRGVDANRNQVIQFGLTVRGTPESSDLSAAAPFFDFGRDKIVRGFKELTTADMHAEWGMS